jgi:hypothetical protein
LSFQQARLFLIVRNSPACPVLAHNAKRQREESDVCRSHTCGGLWCLSSRLWVGDLFLSSWARSERTDGVLISKPSIVLIASNRCRKFVNRGRCLKPCGAAERANDAVVRWTSGDARPSLRDHFAKTSHYPDRALFSVIARWQTIPVTRPTQSLSRTQKVQGQKWGHASVTGWHAKRR